MTQLGNCDLFIYTAQQVFKETITLHTKGKALAKHDKMLAMFFLLKCLLHTEFKGFFFLLCILFYDISVLTGLLSILDHNLA